MNCPYSKIGSPRGELSPDRVTERGLQSSHFPSPSSLRDATSPLGEARKDSRTPKTVINISHSPLPPRYTKTHFSCNEKCWSCYTRRVQGAGKKVSRTPKQVIYRGTTLSHRLRRCQLPFREHIKVRLTCKSQRLTSTVYLP